MNWVDNFDMMEKFDELRFSSIMLPLWFCWLKYMNWVDNFDMMIKFDEFKFSPIMLPLWFCWLDYVPWLTPQY